MFGLQNKALAHTEQQAMKGPIELLAQNIV